MELSREDYHVELFMGSSWDLKCVRTISELKSAFEQIGRELPADNSLEVGEFYCTGTKIKYLLKEGISQ